MTSPTFFHHHGHDRVLVRLPTFLVHPYNLINSDIADEVPADEDKVAGDDAMGVDVTHRVSRRERLLRCDDRYDLDAR
jgi:hypothetical protein